MAAQTKATLRDLGAETAPAMGARDTRVFVGTWLGRPGCTLDLRLTSKTDGRRVVVHKWDDEDVCNVRYITGDFWRKPDDAVEYGREDGVAFDADAIIAAATRLLGEEA